MPSLLIKLFTGVILLTLYVQPTQAQASRRDTIITALNIFKHLDTVATTDRTQRANDMYRKYCRRLPEKTAMALLDSMRTQARKLNDKELEGGIALMRADYYSVNKGFNNTSLFYHEQAIAFAAENKMPLEEALYLHKKGLYYYVFNHQVDACRYFLQAYDKFKEIGFSNIPDISTYILEQAKFYYTVKDLATAKEMLEIALKYPIKNPRVHINVINTIGLIYRMEKKYDTAIRYFERARDTAIARRDSAWIGIVTGNIGSVYFWQEDYERALPLLKADYQASVKYEQWSNAARTLLRMTRIALARHELDISARQLDTVKWLTAKTPDEELELAISYNWQRSDLNEQLGNLGEALKFRKRFEETKDSLAARDNVADIEGVKLKWEQEKYRDEVDHLKTKHDTDAFKRNAVIAILFLLMIIFLLVFNRLRLDAKRDQEMLLIRKKRVDEKLKAAAESLEQYTENLKQNNALIEKFKLEIDLFKAQSKDRAGTENLERLMQAHIMTDETWDEFKKLFTKVHGGFFSKLRNKYPYLTDTDTRLLALVKLGLNNREMANMLGITVEGIKKSKQRLRKKMQLDQDTDIEGVVASI
ncbi:hypothetical protein GCM10028827_10330 [Mucilaginibacter myungsuensis]